MDGFEQGKNLVEEDQGDPSVLLEEENETTQNVNETNTQNTMGDGEPESTSTKNKNKDKQINMQQKGPTSIRERVRKGIENASYMAQGIGVNILSPGGFRSGLFKEKPKWEVERDAAEAAAKAEARAAASEDNVEKIFGKNLSNDFKIAALNLETFGLEKLKESKVLDPSFDSEKCMRVRQDLEAERQRILKDPNLEKEALAAGMEKETYAADKAVKNMASRMELGKSLGLDNTAEDLKKLRLVELNGYDELDKLKELVKSEGRDAFPKIDDLEKLIALDKIAKGESMYVIGRYDNKVEEYDPRKVLKGRYTSEKSDNSKDKPLSLDQEIFEANRQAEENNKVFQDNQNIDVDDIDTDDMGF